MILLLDTTVLIDVLRARGGRRALLAALVEGGATLATAAINIAEVHAGMRPGEAGGTDALLSSIECYTLTVAIARRAGALKADAARKGQTLSLADMIVAATAMEHGLTLMTDNRKDFEVEGLELYDSPPAAPEKT